MTQNLTGRAAAAAASMGQRAAAAGVGLCSTCRHPVRLHADLGCLTGECFCTSTGVELRSGVAFETAPVVPPSADELALLDVMCTCGHARTGHKVNGSHVQCRTKPCSCLGFNPGGPVASVAAPPSAPAPPPATAAPAPAAPPAAAPDPVGEQPAPRPVAHWSPPRLSTARPAATSAPGPAAVVGEPDAVEEVAAVPPPAATVEPEDLPYTALAMGEPWRPGRPPAAEVRWDPPPAFVHLSPPPVDFGPLLAAALYVSARWYCPKCHQWPLNPGACPGCRRTLQAVYHVTIPRSEP